MHGGECVWVWVRARGVRGDRMRGRGARNDREQRAPDTTEVVRTLPGTPRVATVLSADTSTVVSDVKISVTSSSIANIAEAKGSGDIGGFPRDPGAAMGPHPSAPEPDPPSVSPDDIVGASSLDDATLLGWGAPDW